jgi:hypothetical protein
MSEARLPVGPGPRAKRGGTPIKNGKGIQVTSYPRERTKSVLVVFAAQANQGLSAFLIIAGLEKAARMKTLATGKECTAQDLVPADEYAELLRKRGGKGKS